MWTNPTFRCLSGPILLCLLACSLGLPGCSQNADEASDDSSIRESGLPLAEPGQDDVVPQPAHVARLPEPQSYERPIATPPIESAPYALQPIAADTPRPTPVPSPVSVSPPPRPQPRMMHSPPPSAMRSGSAIRMEAHSAMSPRADAYPIAGPPIESSTGKTLPAEAPSGRSAPAATAPFSSASVESGDERPESTASEEPPAAEDYELVTVFYGTDRKAEMVSASGTQPHTKWLYATVVSAAMAFLSIILVFRREGRMLAFVATVSLIATAVLSVVTVVTRMQAATMAVGPQRTYGPERGTLQTGTCQVSIPKHHQVGEVESPSVFRFEFVEDPRKHVVLLSVDEQPADRFFADIKTRVEGSRRKEAFVFVHGYNVTFEAAARRTAQLAHDLQFDGAPIFYSWPSQGGLLKYTVDETNAAWTMPNLKQFLVAVAQKSGADSVHLIAHSMGNRPLTASLQSLAGELPDGHRPFREVILTAPDIDADVFRRDIAPAIVRTADRITLYASSNDKALQVSKQFHGYRRAGDSGEKLVIVPGVDTVDVSAIDSSLIGHSYYGSNGTVVADIFNLLVTSKAPDFRPWLEPARLGQSKYWVFLSDRGRDGTAGTGTFPARR